jgi:hypothetical protein
MPRFEVKQTAKLNLTSYSGLALIGQCCQAGQVGQRLDAKASELRALTDELSVRLLERTRAPITPYKGYVRFEIDTFVMDNSDTKKEDVGRTYQGVDGYCPIAGYLGNEGWNVGLELRVGAWHCARQTEYFYERAFAFARVKRLVKPTEAVLMVEESGFDSARLLFAKAQERDAWAAEGRVLEFITKCNPRKQDKWAWVAKAEAAGVFQETRPGKRVGLLDLPVERAWGKEKRNFRLIVGVTERTIDRKGQHLLAPEIELEGWWTSLDLPAKEVIEHYQYHGALMYRAEQPVAHARRLVLDFGCNVTQHIKVFVALQERLLRAASPWRHPLCSSRSNFLVPRCRKAWARPGAGK